VNAVPGLNRREFLAAGTGLLFGLVLPRAAAGRGEPEAGAGIRTAWLHIAPDDRVTILAPAAEMGQGTMTAQPLILAEELDADWDKVEIEPAPPDDALYANPVFWAHGIMLTAGSSGVYAYYEALRRAGAQARRILLDAAAAHWQVPAAELETEPGVVAHRPSGRRLRYGEIAAFAKVPAKLPEITDADLKSPDRFRLIGRDVPRRDLPGKVDGSARYSIDVRLPDLIHASVLHAPIEGAVPRRVDDAGARAVPGFMRVIELPHGVATIARTTGAALAAARALAVEWSPAAGALDSEAAMPGYFEQLRDPAEAGFVVHEAGDVIAALAGSARRLEAEYRTDFVYHAQLEPNNAVAWVRDGAREVEIWAGTQTPTHLVRMVAETLAIEPARIRLNRTLLGGAFGNRLERAHRCVIDAVLLSRELDAPVKVTWSRETDLRCGRYKPMTAHWLRAGLDEAGRLLAWHHRLASDEPQASSDPFRYESGKGWPAISSPGMESLYAVANQRAEVLRQTTGVRLSPLRGVGGTPNKFAQESFVDEIARAERRDALAFRLALLEAQPRAQRVLRAAAEMAGWPGDGGLGISFVAESGALLATVIDAEVDRASGTVRARRVWAAIDLGTAVQPRNAAGNVEGGVVYGLSNALTERVSFAGGAAQQSNFHDYRVLRMAQTPAIEVRVLESNEPPGGCAEIGAVGAAAALGNAVAARTGARVRALPLTPERVLAALG
jgi:isoquinoline 1-oxidoreductase beta subunit